MLKKGVIVLGGHVQALGIVRIFGRNGVPLVVIDNTTKNIARHSRYCTHFCMADDEELLEFLLDMGKKNLYPGWIIFPTNDLHVKILSQNKQTLDHFFITGTEHWDSIKSFYNKRLTYQLAEANGIPIAKTYFPASANDLADIKIDYPCIIKPAVMHDFYRKTKRKVFVCRTPKDLIHNYKQALKFIPTEELIIQEIIQGKGSNQFSACFLFLNNKSFVKLTACRLRQHPLDFGNATTYAETYDIPELIGLGERLLKAANYNGICEVEFKKDDRDGQYKLLEVNTRTWKWHTIAVEAGTPFLQSYYDYLHGKEIVPVDEIRPAAFRHALTDIAVQIRLLLRGDLNAFRYRKPVVKAVWDKKDLLPWFYEKFYLLHFLRNR
mgnify:CR=1 FL=1